ncbi:MAG: heat-inducible transcriptional repressor HrcA [candidate division KSB1 bacterium]|nr:heat-inducible transcriptional repressor HrcA [candidate division KSB1 bacterium]MDZ7335255.1 heat-inducible transcriptional repressor HrcA [candidate division KSB1 bacterium]MDZ7357995.1 heat-inducible transcriptional repressor HrcA [candidate division KSB1 bacterium]MDZ7376643.1 heat-inducible transcriptional repressor HrcA [candidate division KSB1 bacterium]MDZ7399792.1 heat-inducible transcriptional repressor HrcA [candidate division KSB1 bacterium]
MAESLLTQREGFILKSLVKNFVNCAMPIGSRFLSRANKNRLSPATIRNIMMDLDEKGLVTQPHASAGRIPTDLGYRYYVNDLMMIERVTKSEKQFIDQRLEDVANEDVEAILEKSCEVLSQISNQLGVVLSPRFYQGKFEKLELVKLSENKLLVIIAISYGLVKTIMMEIKYNISQNKLEETARILNERLSGLTLKQIRETFNTRLSDVTLGDENLISQFSASADKIFMTEDGHLLVKGTQNIFSQPEFANQERMTKLLELIENQKILIRVLSDSTANEDKISIAIGQENKEELLNNCSLITAAYRIGDITGTIGILGPTRMKYEKVISLVDFIAKEISNFFVEHKPTLY